MTRNLIWFFFLGIFSFGCASAPKPQRTPRNGFFDRLVKLPPANSSQARAVASTDAATAENGSAEQPIELGQFKGVGLRWPLKHVQVTSRFGERERDFHEGVDLRARSGTPVFSAHSGKVLYAGRRIRGYGNMIVISHPSGFATVYAHNSRLLVRRGQKVVQGQRIALTGKSGHVSGPHLHFEVRVGTQAVDPVSFYAGMRKVASESRPSSRKREPAVAAN